VNIKRAVQRKLRAKNTSAEPANGKASRNFVFLTRTGATTKRASEKRKEAPTTIATCLRMRFERSMRHVL
jgi:hypothetical protein